MLMQNKYFKPKIGLRGEKRKMTMEQLSNQGNGHLNNKIKYDRYDLRLKGRSYHILVPDMVGVEAWITPGWAFHDDCSFVDGNSRYFEVLYNIAITLMLWPDYMIYLPLRDVQSPPYCPQGLEELGRMDALFYNHQVQLERNRWIKLKNMTKRLKPRKMTLRYDPKYLAECCKRITDAVHRNKSYWMEKNNWHVYYKHFDTLFVEGSRYLYALGVGDLSNYMQGKLKKASQYGIRYSIYALGVENGYFTPSLYDEYVE